MTAVALTRVSSNRKTGPIPVSTTSSESCPSTCPLRNAGCYAAVGYTSIQWSKVDSGERGKDWKGFVSEVRKLPRGQVWRHNVAGDLPHTNGKINPEDLTELVAANRGRRGFTFTHHLPKLGDNAQLIREANEGGFTINLSANHLDEVDELVDMKIGPAVTVLPSDAERVTVTPGGNRVIVCPAVQRDEVTCASCQLCSKADRKVVIGFPVHGVRAKAAAISTNNN